MSHGQSQMVKAATPLHKAMEYETAPGGDATSDGGAVDAKEHCFLTVT